jgi:hypothetical protein
MDRWLIEVDKGRLVTRTIDATRDDAEDQCLTLARQHKGKEVLLFKLMNHTPTVPGVWEHVSTTIILPSTKTARANHAGTGRA